MGGTECLILHYTTLIHFYDNNFKILSLIQIRKFYERKIVIIFLPIKFKHASHRDVFLSTHNICFGREIKKIIFQ